MRFRGPAQTGDEDGFLEEVLLRRDHNDVYDPDTSHWVASEIAYDHHVSD